MVQQCPTTYGVRDVNEIVLGHEVAQLRWHYVDYNGWCIAGRRICMAGRRICMAAGRRICMAAWRRIGGSLVIPNSLELIFGRLQHFVFGYIIEVFDDTVFI